MIKRLSLSALALIPSLCVAAPITTPWVAPGAGISGSSKILGPGSGLNGKTMFDLMNQVDANQSAAQSAQTTANAAIPKAGNMASNGTIIAPTVTVFQTSASTLSISPADSDEAVYVLTPTASTSVTFTSGTGAVGRSKRITLIITQPSTGSFPVTFSGNIAWPNGDAPVVSSAASDTTIIKFLTVNGGQTYFGGVN
ncbi:hypothetical protein [Gluconobacter kondonii]|uniref:hypothetical protein n=1 Tax=Gluconobacter kondonii TaxID=941463 RepID=UPI00197FE333|nr:hypothetical protein [Gluconobacter kondonii]MBN3866467.1 hypothetical protein [Gluconobacter kondonii]